MARVISQETFDEVVKENMEEFEMSQDEAVEEAKKQFLAQGVNLNNIIMTTSSASIIKASIKSLTEHLESVDPDRNKHISNELMIIRSELDKELSIRVFAGKEGLYQLLINGLSKLEPEYIKIVLETLKSLTNGYPDLLNKHGMQFMIGFLHTNVDTNIIIQNLMWMKNCITKHEKNRSELILMKVQDKFRNLLQALSNEPKVVSQICQTIRKLVSDDDIRVVAGNSHEHARSLANETLCILVSFLEKYRDNAALLCEILPTIYTLIVRDEYCVKVYERDGVRYVMDAMVRFPDDEKVNRHCLLLLKGLAGSDPVREPIIQNGAAPLIISAMDRHKSSGMLVSAGCVCISALALRSPSNSQELVDAGAPDLLISVMNMWKENPVIVKHACSAIRNQVSRSPHLKDEYIELGIEDLLNDFKERTGNLEFESKSVLRDLGCDVKLDEPWRGQGRQLND